MSCKIWWAGNYCQVILLILCLGGFVVSGVTLSVDVENGKLVGWISLSIGLVSGLAGCVSGVLTSQGVRRNSERHLERDADDAIRRCEDLIIDANAPDDVVQEARSMKSTVEHLKETVQQMTEATFLTRLSTITQGLDTLEATVRRQQPQLQPQQPQEPQQHPQPPPLNRQPVTLNICSDVQISVDGFGCGNIVSDIVNEAMDPER